VTARGVIVLCLLGGLLGLAAPLWNPFTRRVEDISIGATHILLLMAFVWAGVIVQIMLGGRKDR
jgi:hypothetical protein